MPQTKREDGRRVGWRLKRLGREIKEAINSPGKKILSLWRWLIYDFLGIFREMRWSYVPPLMIYCAYGASGFTGIVQSFFVKNLGMTAEFLAGVGFWAGIPWAFKIPAGHLIDIFWRHKSVFVYLGAALMAASFAIMIGLIDYRPFMENFLDISKWYVIANIIGPVGFVLQDAVADAMTVEAVPEYNETGQKIPDSELQRRHTTMQTLGRIATITGVALVAGLGGWLAKIYSYGTMFRFALLIPLFSIAGVFAGFYTMRRRRAKYRRQGLAKEEIEKIISVHENGLKPDWRILGGSGLFVFIVLFFSLMTIPAKAEMVFTVSLAIVVYLIRQLLKDLDAAKRREIIGIAVIIFVFRALPGVGPGSDWWQIDILKFDEAFFGTLRQTSAILAIVGMFALRKWMAERPIPYLVIFLSFYSTVMFTPFIGMYYGLHEWTEEAFGFGARTIAVIDTMADSPLGQVAMIPMLAWIAREAPKAKKATYFAVMAAFSNLALSAASLGTKFMNQIYTVKPAKYDELGRLLEPGYYDDLGKMMLLVMVIGLVLPVITVVLFNNKNNFYFRAQTAVINYFKNK